MKYIVLYTACTHMYNKYLCINTMCVSQTGLYFTVGGLILLLILQIYFVR